MNDAAYKELSMLSVEKQRVCYWLLRMLKKSGWSGDVEKGAREALVAVGYDPSSDLADHLLTLGEPGRHLSREKCNDCGRPEPQCVCPCVNCGAEMALHEGATCPESVG